MLRKKRKKKMKQSSQPTELFSQGMMNAWDIVAQQNLNTGYGNPLGTQLQDYEVNRFGIFKNTEDMWRQTGQGENDRVWDENPLTYNRGSYINSGRSEAARREAMKSEYPVLTKGEIYEIW
jgi:hypothetical protein